MYLGTYVALVGKRSFVFWAFLWLGLIFGPRESIFRFEKKNLYLSPCVFFNLGISIFNLFFHLIYHFWFFLIFWPKISHPPFFFLIGYFIYQKEISYIVSVIEPTIRWASLRLIWAQTNSEHFIKMKTLFKFPFLVRLWNLVEQYVSSNQPRENFLKH